MHPILASRRHLAVYLTAWLPVVALMTVALITTGWGGWTQSLIFAVPLVFVYAFLCLAAWYPCGAMPLGRSRTTTALLTHIATAVISAALWVGMARVLAQGLERFGLQRGTGELSSEQQRLFFAVGFLLYLLSVAIHYLFAAAEVSRAAERRALEAEVAARDAELAALKSQLNPHFLFNSLNSVASLAVSEPEQAREMCIQLGEYLRHTLNERGLTLHPLDNELAQIRRFLAVEKVRYGDRLRVVERVDDSCLEHAVPPLLLQPLVENALKHGIAELVQGGEISIGAHRRGDRLVVWVENPVDPDGRPRPGAGVGLANVRRRLDKVFGEEGRLQHGATGESYRAQVTVPVTACDRPPREVREDG